MNIKIGIIVMCNNSGLGNQTRRLTQMIKPYRVLAVDSSGFSRNQKQNWQWYDGFSGYRVMGFPNNRETDIFLRGLTHVILAENPFNYNLLTMAKARGIKVYIQSNYEFCDHLNQNLTLPTKFLMPSYWQIDRMKELFGESNVEYLPPPIDPVEFNEARNINFNRRDSKPRFLHIVGTLAAHDRNGTIDLINAVKHSSMADYQLVIRSQHELPQEYMVKDKRIVYSINDETDLNKLYSDFDALILPRRYGGLSLTTNEAMMCGLPVIMPEISPNDKLLPREWLVKADKVGQFMTRTMIDIHAVKRSALGQKIDWLCIQDIQAMKAKAFDIAMREFSVSSLQNSYDNLWQ